MPARIVLTEAGGARQAECRDVMTIGRDAGNDIAPDDPRLPRRQPMPYRRPPGPRLQSGRRGRFQRQCRECRARVELPTRLNDRDRVEIGPAMLLFRLPAAARRPDPPRDRRPTTLAVEPGVELLRSDILVADIRGFTPLTESTPARRLVEGIDRWFRENSRRIRSRDGIVGRFLGDRVCARGETNRDPAGLLLRVLGTACELHRTTRRLNDTIAKLPQPMRIGVGINTGNAAIGTDQGRTANGDAVNLTLRLQEQTRQLGSPNSLNREARPNLPSALWQLREQSVGTAGRTRSPSIGGIGSEEAEAVRRSRQHQPVAAGRPAVCSNTCVKGNGDQSLDRAAAC